MHDTAQLIRCCLADEDISPLFIGVFAADKIPIFFPVKDWCLIANTDPSSKGGRHWVSFGRRWGDNFYFDSYGKKPSSYWPNWARFDKWHKDLRDIQQMTSDVCGDWCLYWCLGLSRAPSENKLFKLMQKFSERDLETNDEHVYTVIHSRFPRILNSTKHFISLDNLINDRLKSLAYPECLLTSQCCKKRNCLE